MKTEWRIYLIGFHPEGSNLTEAEMGELISRSDACVVCDNNPIPVGGRFVLPELSPRPVECIAHEHAGKIAVLREVESPSTETGERGSPPERTGKPT